MTTPGRWQSYNVSRAPVIGPAPALIFDARAGSRRRVARCDPVRGRCAWTYRLSWSHSLAAWNGSPRSGAPALTLAPPDDAPWRQALASQTSLEHWLRGRLAEVIALGHEAEVKLPEPTEGGIRLFDPLCLAAAAHTARREYDAARACLDLALANLPVGSAGKDAWLGLAVRRARLYWLLGALPRLEALLREMEVGTSRLDSSLSPVLLATLRGILALEQENLPVAEQHLTEAVRASVQTARRHAAGAA